MKNGDITTVFFPKDLESKYQSGGGVGKQIALHVSTSHRQSSVELRPINGDSSVVRSCCIEVPMDKAILLQISRIFAELAADAP